MDTTDLTIQRGESFSQNLIAKNASNEIVNLSGYNIRSKIKNYYESGLSFDFITSGVNNLSGIFNLKINPIVTSSIPVGINYYDVEVFNTGVSGLDDVVTKVHKGRVFVYPEVT